MPREAGYLPAYPKYLARLFHPRPPFPDLALNFIPAPSELHNVFLSIGRAFKYTNNYCLKPET